MKSILVTGASKGIGLEFSQQYLHQGYRVFAASRKPENSLELQHFKSQYNDPLVIHQLDISDEESRHNFYQALIDANRDDGCSYEQRWSLQVTKNMIIDLEI